MVYYNVRGYNSDMFLAEMFSWWYSNGFVKRVQMIKTRLASSADFFSVGLLLSTLFAPYKQISANAGGDSVSDKFRASIDKLISRFIGAFIRTFMIIFGCIAMSVQLIFGIIVLIFWAILPISPIIGFILMIVGLV